MSRKSRIVKPNLSPDGPRRGFILNDPYHVTVHGQLHVIPAGFFSDGASIPSLVGLTWALTYTPHNAVVLRAAVVHDYFCEKRLVTVGYRVAAALFHKHLLEDKAGPRRAWLMYQAVLRLGPRWPA